VCDTIGIGIQYSTVLIIFPLILKADIIAQMLSLDRRKRTEEEEEEYSFIKSLTERNETH